MLSGDGAGNRALVDPAAPGRPGHRRAPEAAAGAVGRNKVLGIRSVPTTWTDYAARRTAVSPGRGIDTSTPVSSDRWPYSRTDTTAAPASPSDSGAAPVRMHSTK